MAALFLAMSLILQPPAFVPASGWNVKRGGVNCPGVPRRLCPVVGIASTTPWRDCLNCLPHRTVAAMTRSGIAIKIQVARASGSRVDETFRWPLRLRRGNIRAGFEGLPRRIGIAQETTRLGDRDISVFVFFGRGKPSRPQLRRANAELARARVR